MLTVTTEQEKALYLRPAGALRLRRPGSRCPRGARVEQLFVEIDPQPAQAYAAAEFEAEIPQDLTTHKATPCVKGDSAKRWGIVLSALQIGLPRKVTIPPSWLRRATSLCTRETFLYLFISLPFFRFYVIMPTKRTKEKYAHEIF